MTTAVLERVRIVLVEPAGARNVGMVARVMKNFGLRHLVLVQPGCDHLGDEARQMAVHAGDVLEAATVVDALPGALRGCQRAIATTARHRTLDTKLETPHQALPWLLEAEANPIQGALLFGPEDRGLSNEELNYAQRFIQIPSDPVYPSLNLAQAVAVCSYELYQWAIATPTIAPPTDCQLNAAASETAIALPRETPDPAALEQLEGFYQQLESVLLAIGYLYPHTTNSRMQKFRRLFGRSQLSVDELAMLRGILSQVEWAIGSDATRLS